MFDTRKFMEDCIADSIRFMHVGIEDIAFDIKYGCDPQYAEELFGNSMKHAINWIYRLVTECTE